MELINKTTWSNHLLRRIVSWCCQECGVKVRDMRIAEFRFTKHDHPWSGLHFGRGRIVVRIGSSSHFPYKFSNKNRIPACRGQVLEDRFEALVYITIHEVFHEYHMQQRDRTRKGRFGGSERVVDAKTFKVMNKFRAKKQALIIAWTKEPARRQPSPKPSEDAIEQAEIIKLEGRLKAWTRKYHTAQTKVRKYKAALKYREKVAAKRSDS